MRILRRDRYLLFAGHCYYPHGGADDFRGFYSSINAAKQDFIDRCDEIRGDSYVDNWGQIVDKKTMRVLLWTRAKHIDGDHDKISDHEWMVPEN